MFSTGLTFRAPVPTDGMAVHRLVAACAPLDTNSSYCNLLQCTHFAATCRGAWAGEQLQGFVSAYCRPDAPDTLFIWQVAIAAEARGQGLAARLLQALLAAPACRDIRFLETSITPGNQASQRLFASLARTLQCPLNRSTLFSRAHHFDGQHDDELLYRLGPFTTGAHHDPL